MKRLLSLVVLYLFLISCTEVIFEEPQPLGAKSLKTIPKELRGNFSFLIMNEETLMEVGENFITGLSVNDEPNISASLSREDTAEIVAMHDAEQRRSSDSNTPGSFSKPVL